MKLVRSVLILFSSLLFLISCSKTSETPTRLKLYLAGLGTMPTGVGDGGAILFGKSSDGKSFGKKILTTEEVLDIPNGQWKFYAVFWDATSTMMAGNAYCAKSSATLSGTDVTVNLNATNANCADSEFSNNQHFTNLSGKIQFPEVFIEDCDELPANGYGCGLANQGNALSYRYVFSEFKKDASGVLFSPNKTYSSCKAFNEANLAMSSGINFPVGSLGSPFVIQIEFFLGSSSCNPTEPRGVVVSTLNGGVGVPAASGLVKFSNTECSSGSTSYYYLMSDKPLEEKRCTDDLGTYSGSCNFTSFPVSYKRFMPAGQCSGTTAANPSFKHIVSIPKDRVCQNFINLSAPVGSHVFASGNGTRLRPFKVCTEWQLNQIGEVDSVSTNANAHYKLMNDLDMNKVTFGPYPPPTCAGVAGSELSAYHNLNALDQFVVGSCGTIRTSENPGFTGAFNGNGKTIKNVRMQVKNIEYVGFARELKTGGRIFNLNFSNVEVEGRNYVGTAVGMIFSSGGTVDNVKVKKGNIEARSGNPGNGHYVGAIAGKVDSSGRLLNVYAADSTVRGVSWVGGIVGGINNGKLLKSSFSGHIQSESDLVANSFTGGLVGEINQGSIENSFSEGHMLARSEFIGGITGKNTNANLNNVYSSMAIHGRFSAGSFYQGGLIGYNTGTIYQGIFSGSLKHDPMASLSEYGIAYNDMGTISEVYSIFSPGDNGAVSNILTEGEFLANTVTFSAPSFWTLGMGHFPRLAYESRPCLQVANREAITLQYSNGRGTLLNPVAICSIDQLKNIGTASSGKYFALLENINLSHFSDPNDFVASFSGTLLGGDHYLFGLDIFVADDAGLDEIGLIKVNNGNIVNLKMANMNLTNVDGDDLSTGILVGKNNGLIRDISMTSGQVTAHKKVGLIVGENSGTLDHFYARSSNVYGYQQVGGILGHNTAAGDVFHVASDVHLSNNPAALSDYHSFGGVVGFNLGDIDQVEFESSISFGGPTSNSGGALYAGGITGQNFGVIKNALFSRYGSIRSPDSIKIGGIAGASLQGMISYSVAEGKIIYDNGGAFLAAGKTFHPLIGYIDDVNSTTSHLVGAVNSIGSVIANNQIYSSSGVGPYVHTLDTPGGVETEVATVASGKVDLMSLLNDFSRPMIPFTIATDHQLTADVEIPNGTYIELLKKYPAQASIHDTLTSYGYTNPQMKLISTYCPGGFSGSVGIEVCTNGFNIVFEDEANAANNRGYNRLLSYFVARMNNETLPASVPIWSLEPGSDDGPRLVQLHDD